MGASAVTAVATLAEALHASRASVLATIVGSSGESDPAGTRLATRNYPLSDEAGAALARVVVKDASQFYEATDERGEWP